MELPPLRARHSYLRFPAGEKRKAIGTPALALLGVARQRIWLFMQAKRFQPATRIALRLTGLLGFPQKHRRGDGYSLFFAAIFLAATALVILLSVRYLDLAARAGRRNYALLFSPCIGMMFMASGTT